RGTLFLDEITEMPTSLQLKLLTVLQDGNFIKPDGQSRVEMDVRILAAASGNLEHAMAEGKLREDLYYRLSAFPVHVPPLRERKEEIRSEEHTSELQSRVDLVCRLLLEKKKN